MGGFRGCGKRGDLMAIFLKYGSINGETTQKTHEKCIASNLLLKEALGGKAVEAKIELTQTDNSGKHVSYLKYILTNTLISGYSISSGGDRPSESISLNFTKIDSVYLNIDDKFASKTTGHVIYDIAVSELK
jgi:type VI secretion system secreted protein Hcp